VEHLWAAGGIVLFDRSWSNRAGVELPPRPPSTDYRRPPRDLQTCVPDHAASR